MKILVVSDIHAEHHNFTCPDTDADLVVLAGDNHVGKAIIPWIEQTFPNKRVLFIAGNHEFYKRNITYHVPYLIEHQTEQITFLDRDVVTIDGVRFVGTTGWTDYRVFGNRERVAADIGDQLNDFRRIRYSNKYHKLTPQLVSSFGDVNRQWLEHTLDTEYPGKTVVITHHAPLLQSIPVPPDNKYSLLDAAYVNDWSHLMGKAAVWIHGHTHHAVDYNINGTRVVSNPRGYPGETTGYIHGLTITV